MFLDMCCVVIKVRNVFYSCLFDCILIKIWLVSFLCCHFLACHLFISSLVDFVTCLSRFLFDRICLSLFDLFDRDFRFKCLCLELRVVSQIYQL